MALKYKKPNPQLLQELKSVAQDAQAVTTAIETQNFIPDDFPTATLVDICEALLELPNGTAEGCRTPLEYARGRLPAIRRNHFHLEMENEVSEAHDVEPQLLRGMSFDRDLSKLIASITTALDEYRFQASEQHEEQVELLSETTVANTPDVAQVIAGAESIELSMRSASSDLSEIGEANSENVDTLSRALKDTEGLARVSKAELNFGTVVVRWYKNIAHAAKKMPKVILTSAKAIKVGADIAKSFNSRWMDMCQNLIDFGLEELENWADTAIEVGTKLQKRIDGGDVAQGGTVDQRDKLRGKEFNSEDLYRDGYVSYIEKRGLYAFLVDTENNRYFLRLNQGHLRTGQLVELGGVAKFRYSETNRGRTAIEVTFYEESIFSVDLGVLQLRKVRFDFSGAIKKIASEISSNNSVSLYKLGSHLASKFKSPKPLHEMVGYETLRQLVESVPELSISGAEPNLWVEIRAEKKLHEKRPLSIGAFQRWLEETISETGHERGILLSELGVKARAHFACNGRIPNELGFATYVQVIKSIDTVKVIGEPGGTERAVLSSETDEKLLELEAARTNQDGKELLTFDAFQGWLKTKLDLPEYSDGMLLSRLGTEAHRFFAVDGKVPTSLGFGSYASLVEKLDGLTIVGEPPRQRVVTTKTQIK
ncbi:OST-HTH/LOTUS domain-containing protein [Ruegeria denitrificans]|uniref:OST-HTH/LOTUS domain-containing protein n=1 Tax=Ruegeria denitrificans TaxID=1715692 RepID=UPI003C7B35D6